MVRPQFSRLHPPLHPQDAKDSFPQNRPRRNRSPGYGQANYRKSPRPNRRSPLHAASDLKGNRNDARGGPYRRDNFRGGNDQRGGNRETSRAMGNNNNYNREVNRRPKWRRNRNKKKRKGKRGMPTLSGGNRAPVAGGNRQPIASMRMRMDDYVAPRMRRLLPMSKTNDIERAVARARREASTRTKDTFWTKKLLDAETTHPNRSFRWAHSGFKELYREELGYSELEYKEKEKLQGRSPPRGSHDDFDRRNGPKRPRSPSNKQRTSRERLSSSRKPNFSSKAKPESRKKITRSPRKTSRSRSRSVSRSRSPRSHKRATARTDSKLTKPSAGSRKSTYLRPPNKRPYSRSLSVSPSTISSRSRSYSRSYSSYSRSSSMTSTSSSSTFTASSSGSGRSYRRSYSRSSKSWSRSPSVPRAAPTKIKTASLSKAVQSVHIKKDKKKTPTKPVVSSSQPKKFYASTSTVVAKQKAKPPPRSGAEAPINVRHNAPVSPPSIVPIPSTVANEYYEKEPISNKTPVYVEPVDKAPFKADVRRGPESQNFKGAILSREMNVASTSMRSEGEQTNSESSSDDDDAPLKMTLSERFGKLAQLSSQRQEYEGVRMKIVREGGQDKKVYLEGDSRTPSPHGRRSNGAHERWLREHKAEYDEYEERYGEFRQWDPHRDLPRELPPNWDDVNVRYRYYKESGYFGERSITMEDYLKWEEWWYRYRDWLEKYGGSQEENIKYRGPYNYDSVRGATRDRWLRREKEERKRHRY